MRYASVWISNGTINSCDCVFYLIYLCCLRLFIMSTRFVISLALSLSLMVLPSCDKALQPESERRPDLYSSAFDLEYKVSSVNPEYQYLIPVVHNTISREDVLKKVCGQGWKTTALYQINTDKKVIKEYVLVYGSKVSSAKNETHPNYLVFSADGQSVSFYSYWWMDEPGRYETDPFTYDAANNAITLPTWFSSWGGNGRLVSLSKDTMVCVCTHDVDYKGEEIIYMEVLQRVSDTERQSWVNKCTRYGIRM